MWGGKNRSHRRAEQKAPRAARFQGRQWAGCEIRNLPEQALCARLGAPKAVTRIRPMRPSGRRPDELRPVRITRGFTKHAEGSVLIECGQTRVLCNATVEERVPPWLRGSGQGWVTAEYGMLPRATHTRN